MSSKRHTPDVVVEATATAAREIPDQLLAATRASVLAVGVRRTTLTDVARRAGISRMTVYRLVPDVETLVLEVLTREFGSLVDQAERANVRKRTARARLVGCVVDVVRALPDEPLFERILDVDPERLLPFVTDRLGSTQRIALAHLRRLLTEGHGDGSVRRGDADAQAMTLLLTMMPFVLSARLIDGRSGTDRGAVLKELATSIDRGLQP